MSVEFWGPKTDFLHKLLVRRPELMAKENWKQVEWKTIIKSKSKEVNHKTCTFTKSLRKDQEKH